jgi:dipeptidyl aminopeptidase/acylaminoacyl peptidase
MRNRCTRLRSSLLALLVCCAPLVYAQTFTLQQALSAPYASELLAAPAGERFAWTENSGGRHNLFVGGANQSALALTHNTADNAQDISGLAWSPNASHIAFLQGAERGQSGNPANPAQLQPPPVPAIFVVAADGSAAPQRLAEGHSPLWLRDGSAVLFVRSGKIWIAPFAKDLAPGIHPLVFDRGSASALTLSPDGTHLAYVSTRRSSGHAHSFIALYDLAARTLTFVSPSTGVDSAPAFSPDGSQLAWLRAPFTQPADYLPQRTSANPWSIQATAVAGVTGLSGQSRTVFSAAPNRPGSVLPRMATGDPFVMWTAAGKLLFFSEADGWRHVYEADPAAPTQAPRLLTPGLYEVVDATLGTAGQTLVYASNQWDVVHPDCSHGLCVVARDPSDPADADRLHLWQLDLDHPAATPIELTRGNGIEQHPEVTASGTLAFLASGVREPMHPMLRANDGTLRRLSAPPPAEFAGAALVAPQQVLFHSPDGLEIHAQLFLPTDDEQKQIPFGNDKQKGNDSNNKIDNKSRDSNRGNGKGDLTTSSPLHPAIVFVHGGPRRQMLLGFPAMEYYSNAYAMNQYLASRGFIVLSVNYRGGIGYGLDFREASAFGPHGASEYIDVLAAQQYLASRRDVDTQRIGIWGGSYGGYLTALALARNSNLFAAGVDFHGVHEWALEDNAADWLAGPLAAQQAIAAVAHRSSPMADVDNWRSPVLFIHGDDDPDVAYAQTPLLADALRARHVPVEELIFPDELHQFVLHRDWVTAYERAANFFERTLKPHGNQ